jgi:hypothetical protein
MAINTIEDFVGTWTIRTTTHPRNWPCEEQVTIQVTDPEQQVCEIRWMNGEGIEMTLRDVPFASFGPGALQGKAANEPVDVDVRKEPGSRLITGAVTYSEVPHDHLTAGRKKTNHLTGSWGAEGGN